MLGNTGLSGPEQQQLRELYSFGLAKETWSSYRTAERMLLRCCREKNQKLELPLREETILVFIHWLAFNRNVKATTINTYLSGIRQLHVEKGASTDGLRTEKVNMVLKGLLNKNNVEKRRGRVGSRLPITKDILELLKQRISESDFCGRDQRMVWTVCTVLFHGAFRIHELLCRRKEVFDPDFTLLDGDIRSVEGVEGRSLQVAVKAPKEDKAGKVIIVDVYQTDSSICPVKAFVKWDKFRLREAGQPLFRFNSGEPLTGRRFNEIVRERLKGFVGDVHKLFSSHSFRAGAASMMATLGYSDEDIKAVGRWNSRAFLEYVKLPRTRRIEVAKKWSKQ